MTTYYTNGVENVAPKDVSSEAEVPETLPAKPPIDGEALLRDNALMTVLQLQQALVISPHLPVDFPLDDPEVVTELARLINYISAQVETYLRRKLGKAEYREVLNNTSVSMVNVRNFPIRSIDEVTFQGAVIPNLAKRMENYNDYFDLQVGTIYLDAVFPSRAQVAGLGQYPFNKLRGLQIKYTAGYVLPGQATDLEPCDLPSDLQGLVMSQAIQLFLDAIDEQRTSGLIEILEGNVSRKYSSKINADLAKFGNFTIAEQRMLDQYKTHSGMSSV